MLYVEEYLIRITGVSANQYSSNTTRLNNNSESFESRNEGAHWFETRHSTNTFTVREFH
jgi:hypothetical protein